jgi:O-antigen/teichoic acid export membrane protein
MRIGARFLSRMKNTVAARTPRFHWPIRISPAYRRGGKAIPPETEQVVPLAQRFGNGALWSVMGAVLSRGLGFASTVTVARVLGKFSFGEFCAVQGTLVMFQAYAGMALGLTATKHVAEYRDTDPLKAGRIISLSSFVASASGFVFALVMVVLARPLAAKTLSAPQLGGALAVAGISLIFLSINAAQLGALAGMEAFKSLAILNTTVSVIGFPLVAGGAILGSVEGAVWGTVIAGALTCVLSHFALRRTAARFNIPISRKGCLSELRVLWRFAVPSVVATGLVAPVVWWANAILVNQPNGFAELGLYNAVIRVKQLPELMASLVLAPVLPMLSQKRGTRDAVGYSRVLAAAFLLSIASVMPLALILTVFPQIVTVVYGREFAVSPILVQWLMFHSLLVGLSLPIPAIMASLDRMWVGTINNAGYSLLYLLLVLALVPRYKAIGFAEALVVAYALTATMCYVYVRWKEPHWLGQVPLSMLAFSAAGTYAVCVAAYHVLPSWPAAFIGVSTISCYTVWLCRIVARLAKQHGVVRPFAAG